MKTETIKGFKDYTGKDAEKFSVINEVIRRTFEQFNFELNLNVPELSFRIGDNFKGSFIRGERYRST